MKNKFIFTVLTLVLLLIASTPQAMAGATRPSDQYKAYLNVLYWAKELSQFSPYLMQRTRDNLESLSGQARIDAFKRWKKGYVAKFRLKREEVVADHAFIEGTGLGLEFGQITPATVKVEMILESGVWKIKHQVWYGSIQQPRR